MAQAPTELTVISRTYELLIWTAQHVARFPRSHRFTAGERLDRQLYLVLDKLLRARYSRERAPLLRDVNLELEVLRYGPRELVGPAERPRGSFGERQEILTVTDVGEGWSRCRPLPACPAGEAVPRLNGGATVSLFFPAPAGLSGR